jgi:hypothetical protein
VVGEQDGATQASIKMCILCGAVIECVVGEQDGATQASSPIGHASPAPTG